MENQYRQQQSKQETQNKAMLQDQKAKLDAKMEFMKNKFGSNA
jgi:hypothetical protein